MDSIDYPPPPSQPLCYNVRTRNLEGRFRKTELGDESYFIIDSSCYLSDAREDEKSLHHHLQLLLRCNNEESKQNDFSFVVHRTCVNLPNVIQISRHNHRLFLNSSLSSEKWSCGVCRQKIDRNYWEYSCSKGCAYAVHCKCAMQDDVWDGKELEDQPEEVYDNIKSYEEIGDGIINHFCHPHHNMRFNEDFGKIYYEKKQCEACLLPLYDGNSYRCMQCDFNLHEECANLPRRIQNMVHAHQFILRPGYFNEGFFCESCHRYSCGFRYNCCEGCNTSLDVRCASLYEPVHHQSHPHPLFLLYTRTTEEPCLICGEVSYLLLNCVKCFFALCFCCATLPYKVKHEGDEHFLTLSYENVAMYPHWCEVCEEKMDPKKGYYTCSECGTTIHIQCILGNDPYMKPGQITTTFYGLRIDIIPNNRLIRPICNHCQRRCQYKIIFRKYGKIYCSSSEILGLEKWCIGLE
ncbi:uncharacterized protein LOC9311443 isoform X2 [Arabidopsis lyrata subsp. lyrata]|uniref:uncharacterized protein LOC9311443 isoform X2 n=1 Tax=Arabidopsis lyrata subsp. lyrata TaxID=81972 RepID=UPI000A29CB21|nr:uncharacterized protein LOC9311443 isoform X2 [Arabidopsis lyrata subsp. lyrata]|eukprot:XP_020879814.1 uncharacterized protein LOC9311443 isoform X2 [Arabidopsis lyrata subsp. lyrata]